VEDCANEVLSCMIQPHNKKNVIKKCSLKIFIGSFKKNKFKASIFTTYKFRILKIQK
jgi:hypothetical protein